MSVGGERGRWQTTGKGHDIVTVGEKRKKVRVLLNDEKTARPAEQVMPNDASSLLSRL
jgi:hypothetical protein